MGRSLNPESTSANGEQSAIAVNMTNKESGIPHIRIPQPTRVTRAPDDDILSSEEDLPLFNYIYEEGWDDETKALCTVLDFMTEEKVERRIAYTAKMVAPKKSLDNTWSYDKIFGDDDFVAAGQLIIPRRGRKPAKSAKDNTYIFYVIEGGVNVKINNTSMILCTGAMFLVPRGNTYFIENISNRDAKLFFTQARKVTMKSDEQARANFLNARKWPTRSEIQLWPSDVLASLRAWGAWGTKALSAARAAVHRFAKSHEAGLHLFNSVVLSIVLLILVYDRVCG